MDLGRLLNPQALAEPAASKVHSRHFERTAHATQYVRRLRARLGLASYRVAVCKKEGAMAALTRALQLELADRTRHPVSIIGTGRMPGRRTATDDHSRQACRVSTDRPHAALPTASATTTIAASPPSPVVHPSITVAHDCTAPAVPLAPSLPCSASNSSSATVTTPVTITGACATPPPSLLLTPSTTPSDVSTTLVPPTTSVGSTATSQSTRRGPLDTEAGAALLLFVKYAASPQTTAVEQRRTARSISPVSMPAVVVPLSPLTSTRPLARRTPVKRLAGARSYRPIAPLPHAQTAAATNTAAAAAANGRTVLLGSPTVTPLHYLQQPPSQQPLSHHAYAHASGDAAALRSPWPTPASSPEFSAVSCAEPTVLMRGTALTPSPTAAMGVNALPSLAYPLPGRTVAPCLSHTPGNANSTNVAVA
ncbi:hypothetical protein THASP1DRAFT_27521 [Thamnocephalis sphaerospora]|uniref:Uncharacterized protein n=1 Tax=Thamnocephalis sphaerospora TaxID=78915 RepID=A0A4P9XXC9_9FUNG|nr:hypothetical protein THASP1DRAFT_27521 [Thamnocephalis sphaerospora]|eukprot:RKP10682.1 hypothetical protein THASP1DRAFT_27521 [Thamnocephalis sphaerospora]